jgi:chemotaxis regulatin CheY-phosphate phosphatase CheZ
MNDATPRTADLVALAQATDDNGRVDLTAYKAQWMILLHQSIDGLDAKSLVQELTDSPAYANAEGRSQIVPLLR